MSGQLFKSDGYIGGRRRIGAVFRGFSKNFVGSGLRPETPIIDKPERRRSNHHHWQSLNVLLGLMQGSEM